MPNALQTFAASMTCWAILGGSVIAAHLILSILAARAKKPVASESAYPPPPIPAGGLAIFVPFAIAGVMVFFRATPFMVTVVEPGNQIVALLLCSGAITVLGGIADRREVPISLQVVVQAVIALAVAFAGLAIGSVEIPGGGLVAVGRGWGVILSVIWILAFTHSLRFLEGLDRLTSAVAFVCLMALALISSLNVSTLVVLLSLALGGGVAGFMVFNLTATQVSLGWSGKYLLGFSIGVITLMGAQKTTGVLVYWIPLLLLSFQIPNAYMHSRIGRWMAPAVREKFLGRYSAVLRLILAGVVASLAYAVFQSGGIQKTWWMAGKGRLILFTAIFGITWLALNLRPVRQAWRRHRRNLVFSTLSTYFSEQLRAHGDYHTVNSLLAIVQEEFGLDGLEMTATASAGQTEVLGFRPPYPYAMAPHPVDELDVETASGVRLAVVISYGFAPSEEDRAFCTRWLHETLAPWQALIPLPVAEKPEARNWPVDTEGGVIFPIPDMLYEWHGLKAKVVL